MYIRTYDAMLAPKMIAVICSGTGSEVPLVMKDEELLAVAVITATPKKVEVAFKERREARPIPAIPCPEVHPLHKYVPSPSKSVRKCSLYYGSIRTNNDSA